MGNPPRFFRLVRLNDISGVSGTGHVADVVVFSDGEAAVHWLGDYATTTPHPKGLASVERIHLHGGASRLVEQSVDGPGSQEARDMAAILSDLDRCQHGRHQGDECGGCGGRSQGNPHMQPGSVVGYNVYGNPITMPHRDDKYDVNKWVEKRR